MLKVISIGSGWNRWAGKDQPGQPIEPGIYYHVEMGWGTSKTVKDKLKNELGLIAATGPGVKFAWVCPAERWVKRVLDGAIKFRKQPIDTDRLVELAGKYTDTALLRPWQARVFGQIIKAVISTGEYRKMIHVSLGGGKTLLGLLALSLGDRGLVLAPSHVHETWRSEALKWSVAPPTVSTYESAHKLANEQFDVLVCDEIHKCKSAEAARHQHTAAIAHKTPIVIGLTASPTGGGGPFDWRILRVVEHGAVPAAEKAWRYLFGLDTRLEEVAPGKKAYVTSTWDTSKIADFVEPFVTSIDTSDLLKQLPEKTEQVIELPQPKDYALVMKGASTSRNRSKLTAQLRQATDGFVELDDGQIVELADQAKLDWIVETVEHLGEPVVIWANWSHSLKMLADRLKAHSPSLIEGGTGDKGFQEKRFKEGQTKVMLIQSSMAEGLNLQEVCRTAIWMSLSMNPVALEQGAGRIWRPGQLRGVNLIYLQCRETIDQRAYELVKNHNELSEDQISRLLEEQAWKE